MNSSSKPASAAALRQATLALGLRTRMVGSNRGEDVENPDQTVKAPLQAFDGHDFVVGVGPLDTTFVASVPLRQDQGRWKLTADGVDPTRQ